MWIELTQNAPNETVTEEPSKRDVGDSHTTEIQQHLEGNHNTTVGLVREQSKVFSYVAGNVYITDTVHAPLNELSQAPPQKKHFIDRPEVRLDLKTGLFGLSNATDILENPEGQVPLNSAFYVKRPPIETDCYETILKPGALIRIKAPRQMGKTSLISRILHHTNQQEYRTVSLNFQSADAEFLTSLDKFLQWFCVSISYKLNLVDRLDDYWKGFLGSKNKCTNYFEQYLLSEINSPIVLGLDEVDEVFKYPAIASDFFALLRVWHEQAKNEVLWQKLRLVIAHSREVYIPLNINQSPFNVGLPIEIPFLNQIQILELIQRHGLHWNEEKIKHLMMLVSGHPYLLRVALYQIARGRMTLEELKQVAPTEEGPYADHLRRHLLNLEKDAKLLVALQNVVIAESSIYVDTVEAFKLRSMGLVKYEGNKVMPLCDLYRQYFRERLGVN
ncbi:hypothetical protein CDG79_32310 [Nostoc sp. 'Peltigera membranacea cyanobiont' 232]|nr:hypothetical protein CDG79_32310 [Nostoc sp. 'Peltigera membranacea cyanobiont' 232]